MKRYIKMSLSVFLILFMLLGSLTGCQTDMPEAGLPTTDNPFVDDPFEQNDNSIPNFLGWLRHGAADPILDENGFRAAYEYNGGKFELGYHVTATGSAKNVGFLLFLDGIPQPYQINGEGDMDYMHTFSLEEDDKDYRFSFTFIPVTGSVGDTLRLSVVSVNNPQFQPDMKTSTSYGFYHDTLESYFTIQFATDTDYSEGKERMAALSSVGVATKDMTSDFVNTYLDTGFIVDGQTTEERLDDAVYEFINYNGETVYDNINISDLDTVHIVYQMVGTPGAVYRVSIFANHRPLTDGEIMTWDMALSKGKVAVLETDIDVSLLDDFTTFYVFACPVDTVGVPESNVLLGVKTNSVLLYKETD